METEIWLSVIGYEGLYEVSNLGRVRSARTATNSKRGHVLSPSLVEGYPRVTLCRAGVRRSIHNHVLVCEAFHGPRPSAVHEVAHGDGRRTNPRADNLSWKTVIENEADKVRHGTKLFGEQSPFSILAESDVLSIRRLSASGLSYSALARQFNTCKSNICFIVRRQTWTHI